MQGEVLTVGPDGDGVVRADDDACYAFHTREVKAFIVQVGDRIGFEADGDRAVEITLLSASPIPLGAPLHARLEQREVHLDRRRQVGELGLVRLRRALEELRPDGLVERLIGAHAQDACELGPRPERVVAALEPLERGRLRRPQLGCRNKVARECPA